MRWVQLCGSLSLLWHCLSLGLEWKLTFSSTVTTAGFSKFAGILSAALPQHHLSGWNCSIGIPSPPLPLFIVMLPKAHLTWHSRMSGSRLVITPSWLSRSWRSFLYKTYYKTTIIKKVLHWQRDRLRSMWQNRESRNQLTQLGLSDFWQRRKSNSMAKGQSFLNK